MISKQRSSVGSAMSPSTQPFLKVSVTDRVKMGTGVQAYVSYRVITETNMPEYRGPEKIVIRRYSDFVWLHERLAEKNKGIFIPPLPEKSAVGRHRGLDVFINRIASHSQLQHSEDLKHFLQAEEEIVYFRCLDKPKEDEFCLELSKLSTYDDVVERVAQQLGLDDPSKIRLTSHNCHSQEPKPQPIKYRGVDHLSDMLVHSNQYYDILYYEVLDIPLPEEEKIVYFRCLDKPKEDEFYLKLLKLSTYDDVVERVAQQLGLDDPSKIRLTSHNCYSQEPKPQPIKYRGVDHLSDMLVHYNQSSDILYYEVLDIPMPELQGFKSLKVAFHHSTKDEVSVHSIRLPKQSTVGDVINELRTKVELSHPTAEIRLLEVFYHKIYKIFPPNEKIENINDQYWTLRAEEIPEEEKNLGPHDRLIHVYHFTRDALQNHVVQNFGEPFFLGIREGETLSDVKERIQKKLQVPDEEFSKWKFAFLSLCRPDYLQDTDVILSCFQGKAVYGAWEQYLGLEHSDSAPKRSHQTNQNHHTFEKPVKIYN